MTASEVHVRYTSFVGGALALGMISTITALSSAYWLFARKQYQLYNALVFIASIICLYFSFSRRGYVILALGLLVLSWGIYKAQKRGINMLFVASLLIGSTVLIGATLGDLGTVFSRVWSTADFIDDPSNVLRAIKWIEAFNTIAEHPLLGVGFGASGTLGRDPSELLDADNIFTAESYYLQVIMEGGILVGVVVFFIIGQVVFGSLKRIRHDRQTLLSATILVSMAFESIAGAAITSPLMAILFWLAYGINSSILGKNVRYAQERVQYDKALLQSSGSNRPRI
jgi:O-antigen ligase